jgi:hypothetical protein
VVPWRCDDKDCAERWHKGTFWIQLPAFKLDSDFGDATDYAPSTYTYDAYSDGDHEGVDFEDVPDGDEVERLWAEYHEECALTGQDPLGEYIVPRYHEREGTWQAQFGLVEGTHGCVVLLGLRRSGRGKWMHATHAPPEVREYLDVVATDDAWEFNAMECETPEATLARLRRLAESDPDVKVQKGRADSKRLNILVRVTEKVYRPRNAVAKDIRRVAKQALKERRTP